MFMNDEDILIGGYAYFISIFNHHEWCIEFVPMTRQVYKERVEFCQNWHNQSPYLFIKKDNYTKGIDLWEVTPSSTLYFSYTQALGECKKSINNIARHDKIGKKFYRKGAKKRKQIEHGYRARNNYKVI